MEGERRCLLRVCFLASHAHVLQQLIDLLKGGAVVWFLVPALAHEWHPALWCLFRSLLRYIGAKTLLGEVADV